MISQQSELAACRFRLPQAGHRKQRFARLDESNTLFKKSVGEKQAAVLQVWLEPWAIG
jgi:hypothetical protein